MSEKPAVYITGNVIRLYLNQAMTLRPCASVYQLDNGNKVPTQSCTVVSLAKERSRRLKLISKK